MAQEYKTPEWKKWSSVYCSGCSKWLGNFHGWFAVSPIQIKLYCRKCTEEKQREQQSLEIEKQ